MNQIMQSLAAVGWLEVIRSVAPVVTAGIAFVALKNWQRQDKAKRQAEFLDAIIEAAHTFIFEIQTPISLLRAAKIGMASHVRDWEEGETEHKIAAGAIAYIKQRGKDDGEQMRAALAAIEPAVVKLRSLASKGQVFKFRGYAACQDAITQLTWQFDRVVAFTGLISSPTMNWEHPEVRDLLTRVVAIEPDEIHAGVSKNGAGIMEFARTTYQRIYP